jgi:hypothetical protein
MRVPRNFQGEDINKESVSKGRRYRLALDLEIAGSEMCTLDQRENEEEEEEDQATPLLGNN